VESWHWFAVTFGLGFDEKRFKDNVLENLWGISSIQFIKRRRNDFFNIRETIRPFIIQTRSALKFCAPHSLFCVDFPPKTGKFLSHVLVTMNAIH